MYRNVSLHYVKSERQNIYSIKVIPMNTMTELLDYSFVKRKMKKTYLFEIFGTIIDHTFMITEKMLINTHTTNLQF